MEHYRLTEIVNNNIQVKEGGNLKCAPDTIINSHSNITGTGTINCPSVSSN